VCAIFIPIFRERGCITTSNIGQIAVDLVLNQKQFVKDVGNLQSTTNSAGNKIASSFKKIAVAAAAAFSVKQIADFGKQCIDLGSNLAEVQNVVDTVFTSMSSQINDWAKSAAGSYGLSETMAKKYTGTFGAMAKAFGFTEKSAYNMSTSLTGLAGDVASFYNISQDEAYTKLKSVFSGETETLKDLGIVMTQNALDAYAMANGFGKATAQMTESEKVALRYSFVQSKLSSAQGDFAKTQDSWANRTRTLQLRFDSLKATLGKSFIAVLKPVLQMTNVLIDKLEVAAEKFTEFIEGVFGADVGSTGGAITETATSVADLGDTMDSSSTASATTADNMADTAKQAEKVNGALAGFDKLNVLGTDTSADSDLGNISTAIPVIGNTSTLSDANKQLDTSNNLLDKLQVKLTELGNNLGLDKLLKKIKDLGKKLWKQISKYDFGGALMSALTNAIKFVGSVLNFGAGIVFPLAIALDIPGIVYEAINALSTLFSTLGQIVDSVTPGVETFVNIGLVPIATWVGGRIKDGLQFVQEMMEKIGDWFEEHTDMFTELGTQLGIVTAKIWEFCQPIADTVWAVFKDLVSQLVDIFLQLGEKLGILAVKFMEAWNAVYGFLESIGVVKVVSTAISETIKWLCADIGQVFTVVGTIIGTFIAVLGHLYDFITGVFTGDWSKAWDAIKSIVTTVWDGIWASIKLICNKIIDAINCLWTGIYNAVKGIVDDIGSVAGALGDIFGQDWHFSMPPDPPLIPKLAKGGLVKAPTLALVGDNPGANNDPEVVAPLSKLQSMLPSSDGSSADTALLKQLLGYMIKIYDLLAKTIASGDNIHEFIAQLNGNTIFKEMIKENDAYKKRHGGKSAFA